jgi:hypothetical protein
VIGFLVEFGVKQVERIETNVSSWHNLKKKCLSKSIAAISVPSRGATYIDAVSVIDLYIR